MTNPYYGAQIDFSPLLAIGENIAGGLSKRWERQAINEALKSGDYNEQFLNLLRAGNTEAARAMATYSLAQSDRELDERRHQDNLDIARQNAKPPIQQEYEFLYPNGAPDVSAPGAGYGPGGPMPVADAGGSQPSPAQFAAMKKPSRGQTAVDIAFGKDYADWVGAGGYTGVQKTLGQLDEAVKTLGSGRDDLTGPVIGSLSDSWRTRLFPTGRTAQQDIEEAIQTNLRKILGSQYTQIEGENLLKRTFDPAMEEHVNHKRAQNVVTQMRAMAEAKERASKYFEANGTLVGFRGFEGVPQSINDINPEGEQATTTAIRTPPPPSPDSTFATQPGPVDTMIGNEPARVGPGAAPPLPPTEDKNKLFAAFKRFGPDPAMMEAFDKKYKWPGLAAELIQQLQAGR
jgi:hypothetical protein